MNILGFKKEKTLKPMFLILSVTILYTIYHYQCSSDFFMLHFNRSISYIKAQAISQYYQWGMAFFILGIIPCLIVRFGLKDKLINYGILFKRPVILIFITLLGIAFVTPFVYIGAKNPEFKSIYPLVHNAGGSPRLFFISSFFYLLYYIGYEFCFRGFLFMGIKDDIGYLNAMAVSLIATTLLHVTQPEGETIMAILAGIVFPIIVKKLNSLWPVILIHAYTGISLDYWIIINSGGF